LADGAEYLELDVHATRDGVVVVIHDPTLERTTDGAGAVRDLTFAEIERFDAGFRFARDGSFPFRGQGLRVPSLEEVLEEFPDVPLNIDIKPVEPTLAVAVVSLLERKGALERTLLAAEDYRIMRRIRSHAPSAATGASYGEARDFFERCARGSRTAGPRALRRRRSRKSTHACRGAPFRPRGARLDRERGERDRAAAPARRRWRDVGLPVAARRARAAVIAGDLASPGPAAPSQHGAS
jgi:glycerophosphoryl diester phosphodiesterase